MPLRDDLLEPIAGENPSGQNLRYDRVYEQISEARQEDDESLPMGAWQRAPKRADLAAVIKLAGDALAAKSKDLWFVAWLAESHFRKESFEVLPPCLLLARELQEKFWGTCYPQLDDDGDAGLRIAPLQWMATRLTALLYHVPITKSGLRFFQYRESRGIGYESDAASSDSKLEARRQAIADGRVTAEDFDAAFRQTPTGFYSFAEESLQGALEQVEALDRFHDDKYRGDGPSFSTLRSALEEVKQTVSSLLAEKRKLDPDLLSVADVSSGPGPNSQQQEAVATEWRVISVASPQPGVTTKPVSAGPTSEEEVIAHLTTCAQLIRRQDNCSPVPYLLCSALRLGELRKQGSSPDLDFLQAPSTEVRQKLRRLAKEQNWDELMGASLIALCEPCGRAWLDLQRYIWRAAQGHGAYAIAQAVVSNIRALLVDFPKLRHWTLNDDTPVANAETQQWIDTELLPPTAAVSESTDEEKRKAELLSVALTDFASRREQAEEGLAPDAYDLALDMFRKGQEQQAISLLVQGSEQQPSGRLRFLRRVQVAQLCLAAGKDAVAYPVLTSLWQEIERRGLEGWESGETLAKPLSLLLKCLEHRKGSDADRELIFSHLCRIDPKSAIYNGH